MRNLLLCLVAVCLSPPGWSTPRTAELQSAIGQAQAVPGYSAQWRQVVDHGDQNALVQTYALATRIYRGRWSVTAADCEQNAKEIADAVRTNPMSFALRSLDADCARATGDSVLATKRQDVLLGLMQQAVDELPPDNVAFEKHAIPVLTEIDAYAFARASGEKVLLAHYDIDTFKHLPLALDLWDPSLLRERTLWFDWFDNLLALEHSPDTRFPDFRSKSAQTLLQAFATPGSSAEAASEFLSASDPGAPDVREKEQSLAARGNYPTMVDITKFCLDDPGSDCADVGVKVVQPWLQQGNNFAMLEMACAYAGGIGVKRDAAAARSLIAKVDKRRGDRSGTLEFAARRLPANKDRLDPIVRADVLLLAAGGDPLAETMVANEVRVVEDTYRFKGNVLKGLMHAAESGLPTAQLYLGRSYLDEGQDAAGVAWLEKAASAGDWKAQSDLGAIYWDGSNGQAKDFDRGTYWSELAEQAEVDPRAMALIGGTYMEHGPSTAANKHLAERWLQNSAVGADRYGSVWLAHLYEQGGPGVTGGKPEAITLYRWLVSTSATDAESRWFLARLLGQQPDARRHDAEIRQLLKEATENGDGSSQDDLASALITGRYGTADPQEAAVWYRRAIKKGYVDAGVEYARMLRDGDGVQRDAGAAFKLWRAAIGGGNERAANDMAWTLCTYREFAGTRAREGLHLAQAFRHPKHPAKLDTLAACNAATGDFAHAVSNQEIAVDLMARERPLKGDQLAQFEERLALYRHHVAFVQPDRVPGQPTPK